MQFFVAEIKPLCYLVGLGRLELPTSPLSGVRSSHLSYRPGSFTEFPELKYRAAGHKPRASNKPKFLFARNSQPVARSSISRTRLNVRPG
jgi:hypothetical protein